MASNWTHSPTKSLAQSASGSRPFLHMLNPMSRSYRGYTRANESLIEEEEHPESGEEEIELQAGDSRQTLSPPPRSGIGHSTQRQASQLLRPNIHQEDRIHGRGSSDEDDEVPKSFMIETASPVPHGHSPSSSKRSRPSAQARSPPLKTQGRIHSSARKTTEISHPEPSRLVNSDDGSPQELPAPVSHQQRMRGLDHYERALWNWVNVYNLDAFLQEVYSYYNGKGIYSIALARGLNLLTVGFVIGFSTFLLGCIDYSRIKPEGVIQLSDVVISRCPANFSGFTLLSLVAFLAFYLWQIATFVLGIRSLIDMYNFYTHLLRIPDADIQTISWSEIVRRIGAIREENPITALSSARSSATTANLDAHDIANRIMRQENYLIALFNKELLDLRVPLPYFLKGFVTPEEGKGKILTRVLEWNLRFCLMGYLFDHSGRVRKLFLKEKNRRALIDGLQRRLVFMGILNAVFAPFIIPYILMYSFFRYFEEYHKNPSAIGGRRYTPFAQWKFREFNELPHLFSRRLDESYPIAEEYIGQFPNEKLALIMRFVAFVAGSFAAVLLLASLLDPDVFLHLEITPNRTVIYYLGIFVSGVALARGLIPDTHRVFDPEALMTEIIQYTHYMPNEWKNQLHSKNVHAEFGKLFDMKITTFVQELLSVILTPFVLWCTLPICAPALVDFFREFTVHVDGLGYVCSFALFDFQRHGNVNFGAPTKVKDVRLMSNEGKMEKSFLNFKSAHPEWRPTDPSSTLYLTRVADYTTSHRQTARTYRGRQGGRGVEASHLGDRPESDRLDQTHVLAGSHRRQAVVATSSPDPQPGIGALSTFLNSTTGPMMAPSISLGDSAGSEHLEPITRGSKREDPEVDDGVISELGDSYIDGRVRRPRQDVSTHEEEDIMAEDGVLGLLAQIYAGQTSGRTGGRAPIL